MRTLPKRPDPWRLIVRLKSRRVLLEYVAFHNITGRELARRADKIAKKNGGGVGPGIVGHLMRGGPSGRDSCNLVTAQAIEEALGCPPGFLFEPTLSPVADTKRQSSVA
jgi:hypothetical protein